MQPNCASGERKLGESEVGCVPRVLEKGWWVGTLKVWVCSHNASTASSKLRVSLLRGQAFVALSAYYEDKDTFIHRILFTYQ